MFKHFWHEYDILTKTIKEILTRDNVITETELRVHCFAARPRRPRCVDTTGQLLHSVDDVVKSDLCICAWVGPVPTVPLRQLGHSSLKKLDVNNNIQHCSP